MKPKIHSIKKTGYGHWEVVVSQYNCARRYPFGITSTTFWKVTTTDSMLIDDYHDGLKRAEKSLIRYAKTSGMKTNENY